MEEVEEMEEAVEEAVEEMEEEMEGAVNAKTAALKTQKYTIA